MTKEQLRKQMRTLRRQQSNQQRAESGQQFMRRFIQLPSYRSSQRIACYCPLWGELDTKALMDHAHALGKQIYLPVIESKKMWFARWSGAPLPVHRTTGLVQPHKSDVRLANSLTLDLVVVPLVAFDRRGFRLGQGGGYYDRFFARQHRQLWRKPKLIGAAYGFQEAAKVPDDSWDVPLAGIVTDREVIMT